VSSLSRLTPWCLASHLLPHRCCPLQRTFIGGYHYRTSSTAWVATARGKPSLVSGLPSGHCAHPRSYCCPTLRYSRGAAPHPPTGLRLWQRG
jgi:hypothetical protein